MSGQPNISQLLATLAAQRPYSNPSYAAPVPPPQQAYNAHSLPPRPQVMPPPSLPPPVFHSPPVPQPNGSGTINLYDIKPVSSGSVNLANPPINSYAAYPTPVRSSYRASRSRSRSPLRLTPDRFREQHNPYREERRKDPHITYVRDHSPGIRDSPGNGYSPLTGRRIPGPPDRSANDKSAEVVMIDSSVVGLIIGRQGENMRQIEADTQTRIQFEKAFESNGPMRRCTITGSKPARDNAVAEINRIIDENETTSKTASGRAPPPPGRDLSIGPNSNGKRQQPAHAGNETVIMVPSKTVGLVIGKGGETIKDLQDRSHCHVNIMPEEQTVNGLRPVHLLGTPQQAAMAKDLIMEIVHTDAKKLPNHGSSARDSVNVTTLGVRSIADKITDGITVPSEAVGMIIGKGGETIREMQSATGCKINVSQPSGRDIEREIELIGSHASIDQAKAGIMEKVNAVEKNIRVGGGARPNDPPYPVSQTPQKPAQSQPYPFEVGEPPGGHEAYAAYGGYQKYVALWYASTQSKQAQPNATSPTTGPPGSSYF